MKNKLKRKRKVLFVLIALFALISTVYAYAETYSGKGYLLNEIKSATNVVNDPITGYITASGDVTTKISGIKYVANLDSGGGDAENGIRVFTTVYFKKTSGLFPTWKKQPEKDYQVVKPSTTSTPALNWANNSRNNVRIEWQNRTGNTQLYGTFTAE